MKNSLPCSSAALLHPITLAALALWALNDHLLKGWGPALLTGKLSDVAGLAVCPTVLLGILEWCAPVLVRRHRRALLIASCCTIGLLVAGLELSKPVQVAYQHGLGAARFIAGSLLAWVHGGRAPAYVLVATTPDLTDLLALPALVIPCWLASARQRATPVCAHRTAPRRWEARVSSYRGRRRHWQTLAQADTAERRRARGSEPFQRKSDRTRANSRLARRMLQATP